MGKILTPNYECVWVNEASYIKHAECSDRHLSLGSRLFMCSVLLHAVTAQSNTTAPAYTGAGWRYTDSPSLEKKDQKQHVGIDDP